MCVCKWASACLLCHSPHTKSCVRIQRDKKREEKEDKKRRRMPVCVPLLSRERKREKEKGKAGIWIRTTIFDTMKRRRKKDKAFVWPMKNHYR